LTLNGASDGSFFATFDSYEQSGGTKKIFYNHFESPFERLDDEFGVNEEKAND